MLIRVNTDALREGSKKYRTLCDKTEEIRARGKELGAKINAAWDGSVSDALIANLDTLHDALSRISKRMRESAEELQETAESFEAIDCAATNMKLRRVPDKMGFIVVMDAQALLAKGASVVRIIPDEVMAYGEAYRKLGKELDLLCDEQRSICDELQSVWEGQAFQMFDAASRELMNQMQEISTQMISLGERVHKVAQAYGSVDACMRLR